MVRSAAGTRLPLECSRLPSEHLDLLRQKAELAELSAHRAALEERGGPRAGDSGSGSTDSPRWRKNRSMLAGNVTSARSFLREPQRSQRSASMASILFINRAQDQ